MGYQRKILAVSAILVSEMSGVSVTDAPGWLRPLMADGTVRFEDGGGATVQQPNGANSVGDDGYIVYFPDGSTHGYRADEFSREFEWVDDPVTPVEPPEDDF